MSEQAPHNPEQQILKPVREPIKDGVRVLDPAHPLKTKKEAEKFGYNGAILGILTLPAAPGKDPQEIAFVDYGDAADTPGAVPKYNDGSGKDYIHIFGYAKSRFGVQVVTPQESMFGYVALTPAQPGDPNEGYHTFGRAGHDRNRAIYRNSLDVGIDTTNMRLSSGHFSGKVEGQGNSARVLVAVHSTNENVLEYMAPVSAENPRSDEVYEAGRGLAGEIAMGAMVERRPDDGTDGSGLITHIPKL